MTSPPILSPVSADVQGFIFAAAKHGSRTIAGKQYARIWTFATRIDALREGRYWSSRKFSVLVRPEKRGYTLCAALTDELLTSLSEKDLEEVLHAAEETQIDEEEGA